LKSLENVGDISYEKRFDDFDAGCSKSWTFKWLRRKTARCRIKHNAPDWAPGQ
jgi:hypothetical protein